MNISWTPTISLSCATCSNPIANPTVTTTYTCVVGGGQLGCWTATDVITLSIANPTVICNTPTICPGQTATITASGADNFYWSYGSFPTGLNTGGAAPLVTTDYTVTGNTDGCTAIAVVTVVVISPPVITVNSPLACITQTINLTASATGVTSYYWQGPLSFTSNAQNPSIPNASLPMSGQYTVTVNTPFGCTNTAVANAVVQSNPVPLVNYNSPVCLNSDLALTASGANSFTWTGPNSFTSALTSPTITNVSMAATGIYTVIGAIGSCTGSSTTSITISPLPNPTALNNGPVCAGTVLSFSALGAVSYIWYGPSNFGSNSQNPSIATATMNNSGTYTVVATGANSCTNSAVTIATVNPLPVISGSNLSVCFNQPLNLTANGGQTYLWNGPGFTSTSQNTVIPNAGYAQQGHYTLTVTSGAGCSSTDVSTVTILALPIANIISTSSLCANSNLVLSGTGGNSYLWNGPNNFSSGQQSPVIYGIPLGGDGIYTLSVTVGNCVGVTTKSIAVMPLPAITASNTGPACESKTFQLLATGGIQWAWLGPNTFSDSHQNPFFGSASPLNSGTYTLTITDGNNCQSTAYTNVLVNPTPTISAVGATVCSGQSATITANGGVGYQWIGPSFTSTLSNATIPQVTTANEGDYTIIVAAATSCTNISSVNVKALPLPSPSLIVTPRACLNSTVSLQGLGGVAYQWSGPANFLTTQQNYVFNANSLGYNGVYTLTAYNFVGCANYTTASIIIDPLPDGSLNSDNPNRCVPFCSNFALLQTSNAQILNTVWKINGLTVVADTFYYCVSQPGDLKLTGSFADNNGCANTSTFVINAYPVPVANFAYDPQNPVENTDLVSFTNLSEGDRITKWSWSFMDNSGYKTDTRNASYLFTDPGLFPVSLVVKNAWGCSDTVVEAINVDSEFIIFVPNAFTPNADGKNEIFQPKGRGVVKYNLAVYDRWGANIFQTNEFDSGWDGSYKGKACMSDVYQWKIHAEDKTGKSKELAGHVTLYR